MIPDKEFYTTREFAYKVDTHVVYLQKALKNKNIDMHGQKDEKNRWIIPHSQLKKWDIYIASLRAKGDCTINCVK